jgi:hypothetical protein
MEDQPSSLAVLLKVKTADNISKQSENDNRKEIESEKKPKLVKKKYQFGISFQSESDKQRFFELIKSLKAKNGIGVKESTRDLLFRALDALKVCDTFYISFLYYIHYIFTVHFVIYGF